jgi:hypothetical protein
MTPLAGSWRGIELLVNTFMNKSKNKYGSKMACKHRGTKKNEMMEYESMKTKNYATTRKKR